MSRIVLANGCFDPLHVGHLLHLQQARQMGDVLVVALTSDASVRKEKGASRPLFDERQRAIMVGEMRCVDEVRIVPDVITALQLIKPAVFVKGPDYAGRVDPDVVELCDRNGVAIRFTDGPKWSATSIGNELRSR